MNTFWCHGHFALCHRPPTTLGWFCPRMPVHPALLCLTMSDCIVEENVWSCRLSGPSGSTTIQLPASYHFLVFVLLCFSGIVQWCTGTDVHAFCSEGCFCTQGDPRCNSSGGPSLDLAARVALARCVVTRCRWRSPSSSTRETGAMSAASRMAEADTALSSMTGFRHAFVHLCQGS